MRAEGFAAEHAALRRVATVVAEAGDPGEVYAVVALEAAGLLGADAGGVLRDEGADGMTVMGAWTADGTRRVATGSLVPSESVMSARDAKGGRIAGRVVLTSGSATPWGYSAVVTAPVRARGRTWGLLTVGARSSDDLTPEAEARPAQASLTLSAGVADLTTDDDGPALLSRADLALYNAKAAGRDRVWVADRSERPRSL